jgi:hypothetical protein
MTTTTRRLCQDPDHDYVDPEDNQADVKYRGLWRCDDCIELMLDEDSRANAADMDPREYR